MGLLDKIFRKRVTTKTENENLPSFWEDDYCQIQIVPRKNIDFINTLIKQIGVFAEKIKTEHRFTDIFVREGLPFPMLNEELRVDYFEKFLAEKGFEKAKQIRYDGYTITDCSKITSNAFSLPCFNFFYDYEDQFINNIWILTSLITSTSHFDKILETFYELGQGCDLVLVNWNTSELIDLANKSQIEKYLMGYWK